MLYRGMERAALDVAYNNTAAVGQTKRAAYVADWTRRSDAIRTSPGAQLDLRYGDGARQRLDVFPCGTPGAPTLSYIHGGYWQMNDKEPYAFLGEGLRGAGFNLALIEYTLAPAARMDQIVGEVRRAVVWVIDHAKELGGDSARVYVSGHSAGGHLTAMAMTESRLAGGVAISGIYDLEPIRLNYFEREARPGSCRNGTQQPDAPPAEERGAARGDGRPRRAARARAPVAGVRRGVAGARTARPLSPGPEARPLLDSRRAGAAEWRDPRGAAGDDVGEPRAPAALVGS